MEWPKLFFMEGTSIADTDPGTPGTVSNVHADRLESALHASGYAGARPEMKGPTTSGQPLFEPQ